MMELVRAAAAAITLLLCAWTAQAGAAEEGRLLVPVGDFYRVPTMLGPKLSPNGRYVAVSVGNPKGLQQLAVVDLQDLGRSKVVGGFADADVTRYEWVNDDRLVYSVDDRKSATRFIVPGLWAVNRDGSDDRQLIRADWMFIERTSSTAKDRRLDWRWQLFDVLRDGSDDVIVRAPVFDTTWTVIDSQLLRMNTRTGLTRSIVRNAPSHASHWVLDREGEPAAVTTWDKGGYASYLKDGDGWKLWQQGSGYTGAFDVPYWVGPQGRLWVLSQGRAGIESLHLLDRASLRVATEATVELQGYDFAGAPIYDRASDRVLGYRFETDAHGTLWLDPAMKAVQGEVDKLLPATVNRIDCEQCLTTPNFLVSASSDRQPPLYYLYSREDKSLQRLGAARPWINPAQMGPRDVDRYTARDGLSVPLLLTRPAGRATGPRPTIILVHGGPWVRGNHWEWERDAQFLASRGYLVIEPEFRGSTGYGDKLYRAGWKQWGLAMQDDVTDATRWAIDKGLADPLRICIAGASYGGYATLMGLIQHPDLYRCGFQWVGVSDIDLMYSINWSDMSDDWKRFGMPVLIGDRDKDAAQLKSTSPVEQAARLRRPLLMGYGGSDRRVPIKHGEALRDALDAAGNRDVEWVAYPEEGHGWHMLETNVDWWTRVEKFLDRQIGPGWQR